MPKISYFWLFLIVVFAVIVYQRTTYAIPSTPSASSPTVSGDVNSGVVTFQFSWTDSDTEDGYKIEEGPLVAPQPDPGLPGYNYSTVASPVQNATAASLTSITADHSLHQYQVVAVQGTARSGGSGTGARALDRIAPSPAPSGLATTPSALNTASWTTNTSPSLSWTNASDAHSGIASHRVSVNGGAFGGAVISPTTVSVNSQAAANTLQVRALDNEGNYADSASLNYYCDNTVPTAPGSVVTTPGALTTAAWTTNTGPTVSWVAGTDGESGIQNYQVKVNTGGWTIKNSGDTVTVASQATANTIQVKTVDKANNEAAATAINYYCDNTVPTAPGSVVTTPGALTTAAWTSNTGPTVSWAAGTDGESGIQNYQVKVNTDAWTIKNSGDTVTVLSQAAANTIQVKTVDKANNEAAATAINYYCDSSAPTGAPTVSSITTTTTYEYYPGTGSTVYYSTGTAGSFTVNVADPVDAESGISGVSFPALAGFSATNGGTDTLSTYSWTYNYPTTATQNAGVSISAINKANLTTAASLTVTLDTVAPTQPATPSTTPATSTVSYSGNATPTLTWVTDSTDTGGSGVALYQIKSDSNSTWTDFTKASALPAGYMQSKAAANTISIRAKDNVVNYSVGTVGTTFYCDTSAPSAVDTSVTGITVTGGAYAKQGSWIVYYNRGTAGSFTVTGTTADPESGVQKIEFPTLAGFDAGTPGGNVGAPGPYTYAYNWTASATQDAIANITAYNNAGLTTQAGFDVQLDITKPTGLALSWGAIDSSSITVSPTGSTLADTEAGVAALPVLIQYDANSTSFVTADISSGWRDTTAWTATGLSANTPHAFRIIARDNVGNLTTALTPTPAYKYTMAANADIVSANGLGTSTWATVNQMDNATLTFSSANLDASPKKIQYYRYIWDTSPTTAVTVAVGRSAPSGNLAFPDGVDTKRNSKSLYLHVRPYNGDDQPAQDTQHYGPYYCVETKRRLRGNKFFDDDGVLVEMR